MHKGFQYNMATGRTVLPAAVIVSLILWGIQIQDFYSLIGLIVCLLSTYILIGLNTTFGIIRTRSYLAPSVFMFMYSAYSFIFNFHNIPVNIIPLIFICSLFFIIKGYDSENSQVNIFNAFLFAGIGCIVNKNMTILIPILLICMIQLRSMSAKCLPAAILGIMAPYWMMTGYLIIANHTEKLKDIIQELISIELLSYNNTNIIQLICIGIMFMIFMSSAILAGKISLKDKVKNRSIIKNLNTIGIYLFLATMIVPTIVVSTLPIIMLVTSIIFGYVMTQLYNRFTLILLISSILIISAVAVYGLTL